MYPLRVYLRPFLEAKAHACLLGKASRAAPSDTGSCFYAFATFPCIFSPRRRIYGYTGLTAIKYLLSIAIGVCVGAITFALEFSTSSLLKLKLDELARLPEHGLLTVVALIGGASLSLSLLAGCLIQFVAPAAAGGAVAPPAPTPRQPQQTPSHFLLPLRPPPRAPAAPSGPLTLAFEPQSGAANPNP